MQKRVIALPNKEKKNHEKWTNDRDWLDFPRPFRWLIAGKVSCGKTTLILNYLIKSSETKSYDNIFLLHPNTYMANVSMDDEQINQNIINEVADPVVEYEGVDYTPLAFIPSMKYFDEIAKKRNLMIIDDIDINSYLKKRRELRDERINKLLSFVSSHKNLSIIISSQDPSSQIPPFIMKMSNVITIYKPRDSYIVQTLSRKLNFEYKQLKTFLSICKSDHDAITFDYIANSPAPYRFNIYEKVNVIEKDN